MSLFCRLFGHGHTLMERAQKPDGRDDLYKVQWRCPRCWTIVGFSEHRPSVKVRSVIHQQRRAARVIQMRKRA
jgi:hypothetical protein